MKQYCFYFSRKLMLAGLFGLLAAPAPAAVHESMNFSDAYQAALQNDATLARVAANVNARRQILPQARSVLLPDISLSGYTRRDDRVLYDPDPNNTRIFDQRGWRASLRQSVFNLSQWHNYRGAQASVQQAQMELQQARLDIILRVVQAYLNVLRARDWLDSSIAEENAFQQQLEQVQQRFDVGLVSITDVLDSTAARDSAAVRRIVAEGDQTIFLESLYRITGRDIQDLGELGDDFPVINPEPMDEDTWVNWGLEKNWSIRAARRALSAAQRTVQSRRANHLPTLSASVTHNYSFNEGSFFGGQEISQNTVQLNLSLPVFQGGRTYYRTKEAKYLVEEAEWRLEEVRRGVVRNIRAYYQAVITGVHRVKAREKAIESRKSVLEATRTGYEVGTRTILDVLQAERSLLRSQFDYADSRYNYMLDMVRLKNSAGTLTPEDLVKYDAHVVEKSPSTRSLSSEENANS